MPKSEQHTSGTPGSQQTARDAFWTAAELGVGLIELDRQECMELLAAKSVGRLAYVVDNGARILPFNYILAEDFIIFRTVPDGEISHHAVSAICAFEVDETDEFFQSGWSVVVVGRLELATEEDFARMLYGKMPEPWAGGPRSMFVRLQCEHVSGRRVIGHGS
jgi:nitroimidazol reductase NimA-like FMN-containing flavoprotein (pyridoxamine 5'-phosphate oxidase superfamily)